MSQHPTSDAAVTPAAGSVAASDAAASVAGHASGGTPLSAHGDRHFDGLADKFSASLYGHLRGELRLSLLDRLLPEMLDLDGQPVLDVGAGLGQQAQWFLERGHAVTLAEPAGEMLDRAREAIDDLLRPNPAGSSTPDLREDFTSDRDRRPETYDAMIELLP